MAATVQINEYNTAGEVETANISDTDMGDTDAANLDPVAYPVTPGENTYEKWQKIEVTAMGGSSKIDNLKIWRTGALGGSAVHMTNTEEQKPMLLLLKLIQLLLLKQCLHLNQRMRTWESTEIWQTG